MADQESWKNVTAGTVVLKRLDHRGEMTRDEIIIGERTFHLTPDERRLNQEQAATTDLDVFSNGILHPVRLIDDSEDARVLAASPNLMSESDMKDLCKAQIRTFEKRVAEINNSVTLERLSAMAHSEDASIRKVEAIQVRLAELNPQLAAEVSVASQGPVRGDAPGMRPVTPR